MIAFLPSCRSVGTGQDVTTVVAVGTRGEGEDGFGVEFVDTGEHDRGAGNAGGAVLLSDLAAHSAVAGH